MMLSLIDTLINGGEVPKGSLQKLVEKGLLSSKVFTYIEIVNYYNKTLNATGERYTSIVLTSDNFKVSEKTVYNALNICKK